MTSSLDRFRRVEVKATLQHGAWLWLGTADGLYRSPVDSDRPAAKVAGWDGHEIQALARDGDGLLVCTFSKSGPALARCDAEARIIDRVTLPDGQKVKALVRSNDKLWLGTKQGVFRQDGNSWRHVFDGQGKAEITRLWHDGKTLRAAVKKMAPHDRPALIESTDGGDNWQIEIQPDYQDSVIAADADTIITKWRGARPRGAKAGFKKHPITAGLIAADGRSAVVDGDKLEIATGPGTKLATYHPAFGDAEYVHLVKEGMVIAGAQGAWHFEPATGRLSDLLPNGDLQPYGKIKRVFQLDHALLAATTFGVFRSFDGGESWEQANAEWWVLDTEHAMRGENGRWWIACQRGLFRSDDQGGRIDYHKLKVSGAHYGELRCLAIAGDKVCVGTKQGLFVNRPDTDAEAFQRIAFFGEGPIEGLAWDRIKKRLMVGTGDGKLYVWDLTTPPELIAEMPIHEATMYAENGHVWLTSDGVIYEVTGKSARINRPDGSGEGLHLLDLGARLLAWDKQHAWVREKLGGSWTRLPNWAPDIRHVAFDAARNRLITTDRAKLRSFSL
jgi:ligand-binding sensor domain-containing protein